MISFQYLHLDIDTIDTHSFAFSYPYGPSRELTESIRRAGVLTPLLVLGENDTYRLFDGHRRLQAARETSLPQVPVAILATKPPLELFSLWIESQRAHRLLNPFEIAALVQDGPAVFRIPREQFLSLLAKETQRLSPSLLPSLPKILSLPERLKREAVQRNYGAPFLVKIVKTFPSELLAEISQILETISLSENQMDQLLSWLDEIAKRDRLTPSKVVKRDPLPFILKHPKMPTAKKRDAFLKAVLMMRFPQRAKFDTAIREIRQKIETTGNLRLLPPPELAGDRFELRVAFRDVNELETSLRRIAAFHKEIDSLTKLI